MMCPAMTGIVFDLCAPHRLRKPKQILNCCLHHHRSKQCDGSHTAGLDWLAGGKIKLVDGLIE